MKWTPDDIVEGVFFTLLGLSILVISSAFAYDLIRLPC